MADILKKNHIEQDYLTPYVMIDDKKGDGTTERVLVTGLGAFNAANPNNQGSTDYKIDDAKRLMKDELLPIIEKEKPQKIHLMCHAHKKDTNELLDYAHDELGLDNISLVIGGHPHSIEDYERNGARVLYSPAQGKGAFVVNTDGEEPQFDTVDNKGKGYNYGCVRENASVIDNTDNTNRLPVDIPEYQRIFEDETVAPYFKPFAKSPAFMRYRNEYDSSISEPSELGTFVAQAYKEAGSSDIGICMASDLRESSPKAGDGVSMYDICDMLNVPKKLYVLQGVSADGLKSFMETSLAMQDKGITNTDFFEYSDNLSVDRKSNADKGERVAQIYMDGKPLLDENGKQLSDKTYTVTVCEALSNVKRPAFEVFRPYQKTRKQIEGKTNRTALAELFVKSQDRDMSDFRASKMTDV